MRIKFGKAIIECDAIAFDKDGTLTDASLLWSGLYKTRMEIIVEKEGKRVASLWARMSGVDQVKESIDQHGPLASGSHAQEEVILASSIYRVKQGSWMDSLNRSKDLMREADRVLPIVMFTSTLPGVPEVLLTLAKARLPMAVLTLDQPYRTRETLRYLGLSEAVKCVVTPEEVDNMKPAPDMVLLAAERLGVSPRNIAVVGDSLVDLQMASAASAIPIHVRNGLVCEDVENLYHAEIGSISEISLVK
jgi:phosphoglycolate phosphatase